MFRHIFLSSYAGLIIFSDPGFTFTEEVHPICLPVESNSDPEKWNEENVEVLGYVTIKVKILYQLINLIGQGVSRNLPALNSKLELKSGLNNNLHFLLGLPQRNKGKARVIH